MGLRVRRSITICKGVRVNFGRTGTSLSFGSRGLRQTIHSSGRRTTSIGIPGTGISYVTSSGGRSSNRQRGKTSAVSKKEQVALQQQKNAEIAYNASVVNNANNRIEYIKAVHRYCLEPVDWNTIKATPAPFISDSIGPRQAAAIHAYEGYKPSFSEKVFAGKSLKRQQELYSAIDAAAKEDAEDYICWENSVRLANDVLVGDIEAYLFVVNEMKPFDDLLEFGSDFEIGTDNPEEMEVEFRVKSSAVVPAQSASITKTGKLSVKDLSKTAYYDLIQDYVCSTTIRIARDLFSLLPVKTVTVHAVDNMLSTTTGQVNEETILSVSFDREIMSKLCFDYIDPSDAMDNFEHKMNFAKTMGFRPAQRLK